MTSTDLKVVFDKLREMIGVANKCILIDAQLKTTIDMEKLRETYTTEEIDFFIKCWDAQFLAEYRGKLYTIEPKVQPNQLKENEVVTVFLMKDEKGEIHSIFDKGIPSWTKEL